MQNLADRRYHQLICHNQNQKGHNHPGHILKPAMPERMLRIRFLPCQLEADHRNDRRARIRKVIECIRHNGNRVTERPRNQLEYKQEHVKTDSDHAIQHAVFLPDFRPVCLLIISEKNSCQK